MTGAVDGMQKKSEHEENKLLRDNYLSKSTIMKERLENVRDPKKVSCLLDSLETIFDDVNEQLKMTGK